MRRRQILQLVDDRRADEGHDAPAAAPIAFRAGPGPEPFEAFYRRELPRLLVLARALCGGAAEDVAQEAMLTAYRRWDEIGLLASPVGYVRGVCLHKAVSVVRRRGVEQRVLRRLAGRREAPVQQPMPEESEAFWHEVRLLPHRQAQVVALFYALDLPVAEVARTLGVAEGSVKSHLSRARAALAERLGVEDVTDGQTDGARPGQDTGLEGMAWS